MMSVISIILILIIAIAEGVCFFSLWLDIGMDNEFLPYIVALICLVLFLVMPYLVSGGFMRLALLKNQRFCFVMNQLARLIQKQERKSSSKFLNLIKKMIRQSMKNNRPSFPLPSFSSGDFCQTACKTMKTVRRTVPITLPTLIVS